LSNLLFLLGIVGDLSNSIADDAYHGDPTRINKVIAMTSVSLWIASACVDLTRSIVDSVNRKRMSAPIRTSLFPREANQVFSFSMLSALVFMAANFCYLTAELYCWEDPVLSPYVCSMFKFFGGSLFVVNSVTLVLEYRQSVTVPLSEVPFADAGDDAKAQAREERYERDFLRASAELGRDAGTIPHGRTPIADTEGVLVLRSATDDEDDDIRVAAGAARASTNDEVLFETTPSRPQPAANGGRSNSGAGASLGSVAARAMTAIKNNVARIDRATSADTNTKSDD
jgi:hypothetical protein